jgi:hypothetical protein
LAADFGHKNNVILGDYLKLLKIFMPPENGMFPVVASNIQ